MKVTSTKKLDLPNGRVTTTKGRERVEIEDEEKFLYWVEKKLEESPSDIDASELLTEQSPKISKKGILKHLKLTGELPEGVDLVRGEDKLSFKIKPVDEKEEPFEEDDGQPTKMQENEDFAHDNDYIYQPTEDFR